MTFKEALGERWGDHRSLGPAGLRVAAFAVFVVCQHLVGDELF